MTRTLAESPQVVVRVVECSDDQVGWSSPEQATAAHLVLVRSGRFRLRSEGRRVTVDPTTGYLEAPGHEARFSHPAGGDVCTSISLPGERLSEGIDGHRRPDVRVDGRLELAHRMLLRTGADPDFAAVEAVVTLLRLALRKEPDELPAPGRYALADRARDAMLADDPISTSLIALADALGASPSHLSRTFHHHAGMSLSRYRNRVRVSRALQRLADGEADLAGLAIALGFSDQAHLTRSMRRELGQTPRRVRSLLATPAPNDPAARPIEQR
ncbi:helix-turn-helix domain-containing protein [Kribbella sp. NPDC048928]|uniref:helix-turn-helix domain-containing protein n=1 Tax=Kribbella sp. NPDC048928 TaxID=3364111 RepID=UPI0037209081